MQTILILGDGRLGRAVADAARERGDDVRVLGRPGRRAARSGRPGRRRTSSSRRRAATPSPRTSPPPSTRAPPVRHRDDRLDGRPSSRSTALLSRAGAAAVAASNFSLGVALFGRLVEAAVGLFGRARGVRPVPRRVAPPGQARPARPARRATSPGGSSAAHPASGDADDLEVVVDPGRRLARDAPRRLRRRRRDRRAAADRPRPVRLRGRGPRRRPTGSAGRLARPGIHPFDPIVDELPRARRRPPIAA